MAQAEILLIYQIPTLPIQYSKPVCATGATRSPITSLQGQDSGMHFRRKNVWKLLNYKIRAIFYIVLQSFLLHLIFI